MVLKAKYGFNLFHITIMITIFNNKISVNFSLKFRNFVGLNFTMKVFYFQQ